MPTAFEGQFEHKTLPLVSAIALLHSETSKCQYQFKSKHLVSCLHPLAVSYGLRVLCRMGYLTLRVHRRTPGCVPETGEGPPGAETVTMCLAPELVHLPRAHGYMECTEHGGHTGMISAL